MTYLSELAVMFSIFLLVGASGHLVIGALNRLTLSHMACFALGAYAFAITQVLSNWPVAMLCAMSCGAAFYALQLILLGGTDNDSFALATLALHLIVVGVIANVALTGGAHGLRNVPRVPIAASPVVLVGGLASVIVCAYLVVLRSRLGLRLRGAGENPLWAKSLGVPVGRLTVGGAAVAGGVVALAGGLYASHVSFITPERFVPLEAVTLAAAVMLYKHAPLRSSVVCALVLSVLPEFVRFLPWFGLAGGQVRRITFACLLIAFGVRATWRGAADGD